jgi:hypothetical protein
MCCSFFIDVAYLQLEGRVRDGGFSLFSVGGSVFESKVEKLFSFCG